MRIISPNDYFEVRLCSILTDYDREILTNLYQPLIGHNALSLFLSFWAMSDQNDNTNVFSHEQLFIKMQTSSAEFIKGREVLEAIGLLKTYYKHENDVSYYIYQLYAPKYPNDFLNDTLLCGLLKKYIGEKELSKLINKYRYDVMDDDGFKEISASIGEVFHIDNSWSNSNGMTNYEGRVTAKANNDFELSKFEKQIILDLNIESNPFDKKQIKEIIRLASLFGVDELTMSNCVSENTNLNLPIKERIDFEKLTSDLMTETRYYVNKKQQIKYENESTSSLATKVKLMEDVSPKDYLRYRQNGSNPTRPDLNLVNDISRNLGLNNPVINALIDFILQNNNNILSRAYTEKIAGFLAREGVDNAIDAMNCLKKNAKKTKKHLFKENEAKNTNSNEDMKKESSANKEEISDEELQKIIAQIEGGNNNG